MTDHQLDDLLANLEAEWRRQGAPVASHIAPGLTDGQIDSLMEPVGLALPDELRTWWRWQNGLVGEPWHYDIGSGVELGKIGPGAWLPMSLEEAITRYGREPRQAHWPGDPVVGDLYWRDTWFPFAGVGVDHDVLFVDTAAGPRPPVRVRWMPDWDQWDVIQAASVTDAVAIWVRALREGYFTWDAQTETWQAHLEDLPPELRNSLTT